MWFAKQIFNLSYVSATYCTSYMKKNSTTSKLHFIIKKCIANNIDANSKTQKLGNVFLNAQQMVVYLVLSLPFYH